jgi:hypothetical protein
MRHARRTGLTLSFCLWAAMLAASSLASAETQPSGFIENLPADMKPDPAGPGALRWQSATASLANYDKVLLEPLTIYVAPDSKEKGLDPDALKSLSDSFRAMVTQYLEPAYPVVDEPGKGVLVVRPALTNVYLEKKGRGLLTFTPVGMVVHAARDAHSKRFSLEKATLEVEALDGVSGDRVAVLIDRSPEMSGLRETEKIDWSRLEEVLAFYAQRMLKRLDAAHGK